MSAAQVFVEGGTEMDKLKAEWPVNSPWNLMSKQVISGPRMWAAAGGLLQELGLYFQGVTWARSQLFLLFALPLMLPNIQGQHLAPQIQGTVYMWKHIPYTTLLHPTIILNMKIWFRHSAYLVLLSFPQRQTNNNNNKTEQNNNKPIFKSRSVNKILSVSKESSCKQPWDFHVNNWQHPCRKTSTWCDDFFLA